MGGLAQFNSEKTEEEMDLKLQLWMENTGLPEGKTPEASAMQSGEQD